MRTRISALAAIAVALCLSSPARGQLDRSDFYDFTLSGGWSWPVEGDFKDGWDSGFTLAGSFRRQVSARVVGGFEVGYAWHGLNSKFFESQSPGLSISGGDAGIFTITTETDVLLGRERGAQRRRRPFLNFGFGFYNISIDDVYVRGGEYGSFRPEIYDNFGFGLHVGGGILVQGRRGGLRLDAGYHHVFLGGNDVGYVPVRLGLVFRPKP